ncbi:MAG TPA: LPXTG cell wall anchor domain-containing protein [Gaiellaceae bacterium]|nr:LPXTG cell wall anchor domain-containing protein [Gaiellaceae bacterium]
MGRSRSSAYVFAAAYIVLVVGLFLALGGAAYAQSPSSATDQYGNKVKGVQVSATAGASTASDGDALPNTGLSLLGVVVVGGALVAGGLVLRRREQRKN